VGILKNAKHEHFAQLVSSGESAARAYVMAGYAKSGARQNSARLMTNDDIRARIDSLRSAKEQQHAASVKQVVKEAAIDKAWVMTQLVENVRMAKQAEPVLDQEGNPIGEYKQNINAANKALELLGKEFGMFIDRKEVRSGPLDGLPPEDLEALENALTRILGRGAGEPVAAGTAQAAR
jgi:hypothetical protein